LVVAPGVTVRRPRAHRVDARRGHRVGVHAEDAGQAHAVGRLDAGDRVETRVHRAGAQRRDRDAGARELAVQRFAEREQERLGRRVGRHPRQGLRGGDRGDVEHRAGTPLHHLGQERPGQLVGGPDVEAHLLGLALDRQLVEGPDRAEARVVAQPDDRGAARRSDRADEFGACGRVGQVADLDVHAGAVAPAQLLGERLQAVAPPGDQRDAVAAGGEHAGQLGADARRGAGDDDGGVRGGCGKRHAPSLPGDGQ
jgi:hypothetical protein